MIEKILNIGNYQYLSELYTGDDFGINESIYANFVMLRNFNIINDVVNDTHILIMEKSEWYNLCVEIENNKDKYQNGFDKVFNSIFPIQSSPITGYSSLYSEFNNNFTRESLYKIVNGKITYGSDVYPIVDHNNIEKKIKCNKIKLYHPTTKNELKGLITIDNYINNIHWYYLCKDVNKFSHKTEKEIRRNNNIYSEYYEIIFPSIDELFKLNEVVEGKEIYNAYFDERLNTIISTKNEEYLSRIIVDDVERYYNLQFDIDVNDGDEIIDNQVKNYYFYVGNESPIEGNELNPNVDVKNFITATDLFNYIKQNNFSIGVNSEEVTYILLPTDFENNVIVSNVLNLSNANNEDVDSLPIFEILCNPNPRRIVINDNEYKLLTTIPKCKKIKLYDKRYNIDVLKYFYLGAGLLVDNSYMNQYESPVKYNEVLDQYSFICKDSPETHTFYNIDDLFTNKTETSQYIYRYNEYNIPNDLNTLYLLIPSFFEDQIIITDNNIVNSQNIMFEIPYTVKYKDFLIDDSGIKYTLLVINNVNNHSIRIYNLKYKRINYSSNIDDLIINDQSQRLINNYISLKSQLVPLNLLLQPYSIVEDIDPLLNDIHNVKLYLKKQKSIENNYIMTPFNIVVFPYSYIDQNTGQYIYDENFGMANNVYNVDCRFLLSSKFGFNEDNHKVSILSEFNYPNKKYFLEKNNYNNKLALQDAYMYYNNIDFKDYEYFWVDLLIQQYPELEEEYINEFDKLYGTRKIENGKEYVILYKEKDETFLVSEYTKNLEKDKDTNKKYQEVPCYSLIKKIIGDDDLECYEYLSDISNKEKIKRLININYNNIWSKLKDWEIEEEYQTNLDFFGFRLQISTDNMFKNLIYNQTYSIDMTDLDDFTFELNKLFNSWEEFPDYLICKVMFIDHILNKCIISNNVTITKEYFKYLINENNTYFIKKLNDYNDIMREINLDNISNINQKDFNNLVEQIKSLFNVTISHKINGNDIYTEDEKELIVNHLNNICVQLKDTYKPFNFINNINCVVKKDNELNTTDYDHSNNNMMKILYQPIFYKTQTLQNIRLKNNITQNIGINLGQYMNKVEAFKMVIDGVQFIEMGRNDAYVLFKINAGLLTNSDGTYDVMDQDDQYISTGNWEKY